MCEHILVLLGIDFLAQFFSDFFGRKLNIPLPHLKLVLENSAQCCVLLFSKTCYLMAGSVRYGIYILKFRTLFFLSFPIKMLVCRAEINKMLVQIANREDPNQTAASEAVLSGSQSCLSRPFCQRISVQNVRSFALHVSLLDLVVPNMDLILDLVVPNMDLKP